jgi:hypothetical protein
MATRFAPNPLRVAEVEKQGLARALAKEKAQDVKKQAEDIAPVHTGFYEEHFILRSLARGYRVGNTDPFAHLVEWGSVNNEPYAPLRRGVAASGLKLHEASKP